MSVKPAEFVAIEQPEVEEVAPISVSHATRRVRVKGTWSQYYGTDKYDFVDGQYYELPLEVFDFLRSRGCIYDVMI